LSRLEARQLQTFWVFDNILIQAFQV
jgi:hypothetical protein